MTELTRRAVMASAATAAMAGAVGGFAAMPARAQTAPSGKQNASWYRYKLGDFEVTVVADGVGRMKLPEKFVTNVPKEEVAKALAANFYDTETLSTGYTPCVINTGKNLVLIDTGLGEAGFAQSKGAVGQLRNNLAASGIDPNQIDTVIISHYHGDHVNGLLKADNSLAFPNAVIRVPSQEHKYWMDDAEMNRQTTERMIGVFKNNRRVFTNAEVAKRVQPYESDKEIVPGITSMATNGHSYGHHSQIVSSGNKSLFVQGDITHVPYFFARNPGWHLMFDQDPQVAEATRRRVYDMLATERMQVQGFHFPFPGTVFIEKTPTGYREHYVQWNTSL